MEENNQKNSRVIDDMKKLYFKPTHDLCIALLLAIGLTMLYTCLKKVEWTCGIVVFGIADVILFGLTSTVMVAMYREMSRLHEKKTIELEEQNKELKEQNKKLDDLNKGCGKRIEELEKRINEIKEKDK